MNELIHLATVELARFLADRLPEFTQDWWEKHVENRLSFQQQRMVQERKLDTLEQLDFAALLRVLDQNWFELSLPREGRNWVKELQTVRNKWAHLSAQAIAANEIYRDADTLGRVLEMLGAGEDTLKEIESTKINAINALAITDGDKEAQDTEITDIEIDKKSNSTPAIDPVLVDAEATIFQVGDLVALRSNQTIILPVIEVIPSDTENRYRVFQDNKKVTYYESQLRVPDEKEEELTCLDVEDLNAYLTSLQLLSPSAANLFSLRSGRVQFVPYQYRPVLKLINADRPRLLIADEVGVGKTIEAGLIIKELRARMDISSVLIICPKALVAERKWFVEMKRFDENFTALDGSMLRHCLQETHLDGEWPDQYSKAIVPFSLFDSDLLLGKDDKGRRKKEGLLDLDPPPKFDLVIVDEAHHIRNPSTYLHQAVRYFCDNAQAAIFLTATPVQLGSEDLFTLLNVLRPDLVIDHASFEQMAAPNPPINMAVYHCRSNKPGWQKEARTCLDEVAQTEWGRLFMRESPAFQNIYDQLQEDQIEDDKRIAMIRDLEELYTFSSMINRTRRRDIGEFTSRKPETLKIEFTSDQRSLHDDLLEVIARILTFCHGKQNVKFMMTTIRRQAASCLYGLAPLLRNILAGKLDNLEMMEAGDSDFDVDLSFVEEVQSDIKILVEHAENLDPNDPKVDAFIKVLQDKSKMPNNKALVFSTFRHTLTYLAEYTKRAGLRYGLIHGDVRDDERSGLRRRFSLPKEDVDALDILLSSEVGCEGLDFQFCDFLINYDLPWNPMRIEQRIGRIDRYGQKSETVAIINLITPGTVDADIYERCLWRIGVFQHAVGGSEEILGEVTREIHDIEESFTLKPEEREKRLQQLGDNGIRQIQEEQALEDKQAGLFGLTVPNQNWRDEIEAAESFWLSPIALQHTVKAYLLRALGSDGEFILGEKTLKTLRLNQDAREKLLKDFKQQPRSNDPVARQWGKWLKGTQPMLPVTFDQDTAAEVTDTIFLNVLHPLVRQAAMYHERTEPVHVGIQVSHDTLSVGEYPFAIYHWHKLGVRTDDALITVAKSSSVENLLMSLLPTATDIHSDVILDNAEINKLDASHHSKWLTYQANHIEENRELIEHRVQSLSISHKARCSLLEDQINQATNEKIRRMKESELARAKLENERRLAELESAASSADVHATPVVFGILNVTRNIS